MDGGSADHAGAVICQRRQEENLKNYFSHDRHGWRKCRFTQEQLSAKGTKAQS